MQVTQCKHKVRGQGRGNDKTISSCGTRLAVRDASHVHMVEQLRLKRWTAEQVCLRMRTVVAEGTMKAMYFGQDFLGTPPAKRSMILRQTTTSKHANASHPQGSQ